MRKNNVKKLATIIPAMIAANTLSSCGINLNYMDISDFTSQHKTPFLNAVVQSMQNCNIDVSKIDTLNTLADWHTEYERDTKSYYFVLTNLTLTTNDNNDIKIKSASWNINSIEDFYINNDMYQSRNTLMNDKIAYGGEYEYFTQLICNNTTTLHEVTTQDNLTLFSENSQIMDM